ncbi:uncharacterized protein LOC110973461 [Acanthaster planci]|uniref:Uncharacterized protein LOC110973461 n=1 Tax=Acanthaster planci TaxID=133434 RepID=A0A8B7XGV0_ACAPL|nr:uncharacterized protein LOC110973461 [Acanthaster planci]XP_022080009.1 uncharacterized protein LOC110973461 [Acanthaster planci]XP_022080019.1 uncharacterized protein LOC110973461 [Acanthaster planci]XP_022080028.1 uncharacterized protein LOC110973461 [Acanthaster planci]XP_022080037.1 uncharacterized protein LOC110973461 [Acanthaster planci]
MDEKTPIFGEPRGQETATSSLGAPSPGAVYHDSTQTPRSRYLMISTVGVITVMVLIALILCIYRGASTGKQGFLYFLVGASLLGFIAVEAFIFRFLQSGDLAKEKSWFLYFMGFCTLLEAVLVAIIVMN